MLSAQLGSCRRRSAPWVGAGRVRGGLESLQAGHDGLQAGRKALW